jgi:D-lactate dehydrogenase (cytochrome)
MMTPVRFLFRRRLSSPDAPRRYRKSSNFVPAIGYRLSHRAPARRSKVVLTRSLESMCGFRVPSGTPAHGPVVCGLAGHLAALHGGISINTREMNQVLQVNPEDMDVRAQAGVTRKQLNEYIRDTGLMFTVDPGADATLGGMASTRASGTNTVKYGGMRDNVLGMTAVLADGSVVHTGSRARKSSTGYDLKNLLIGSEGTLGIITELNIRLFGQPEAVSSAVCEFPTLADAVNCVIAIIQMGVPVARVELMDALSCQAVNKYSKMALKELPTLFFEFHGSHASVEEQAQQTGDIAASFGASGFQWSADAQERGRLWQARHLAPTPYTLHPTP